MRFSSSALLAPLLAASASARFLMYADQWHTSRPTNAADRAGIDHIILAFAKANDTASYAGYPNVTTEQWRAEYPNAKIMIAIGGWGDDGFSQVSKTDEGIAKFAQDVKSMMDKHKVDGLDLDWEYPGGNGQDYKVVPNSEKVYEIDAFPKLLSAVRNAIGKDKILSIAVPGKKTDMIAFTPETGPRIWPSVDYVNIMSYDLINRRDTKTGHHTSVAGSAESVENYLSIGAPADKINLGFAYYAKWFTTAEDCSSKPLGCPIVLAEDPATGADLGTSGAMTYEKQNMEPIDTSDLETSIDGSCGPTVKKKCPAGNCCSAAGFCGATPEYCSGACQHAFGTGCTSPDVAGSWRSALSRGSTDEEAGGQYFYDNANKLFWTWDTPELMIRKFKEIVDTYGLGGVMAWSLGEDSYDWGRIKLMAAEMEKRECPSEKDEGVKVGHKSNGKGRGKKSHRQ